MLNDYNAGWRAWVPPVGARRAESQLGRAGEGPSSGRDLRVGRRRADIRQRPQLRPHAASERALEPSHIARTDFVREVRAAFDMWERVAQIDFQETADRSKADILIGAQAEPRGRAFTNVARRDGDDDANGEIQQSLICLNPDVRWKIGFDGNLDVYDLRYTIAHEVGHAIGLDHPGRDGQLMAYRYAETSRELRAGDIKGAVEIYGSRAPPRLPRARSRGQDETAPRSRAAETSAAPGGTPAPAHRRRLWASILRTADPQPATAKMALS